MRRLRKTRKTMQKGGLFVFGSKTQDTDEYKKTKEKYEETQQKYLDIFGPVFGRVLSYSSATTTIQTLIEFLQKEVQKQPNSLSLPNTQQLEEIIKPAIEKCLKDLKRGFMGTTLLASVDIETLLTPKRKTDMLKYSSKTNLIEDFKRDLYVLARIKQPDTPPLVSDPLASDNSFVTEKSAHVPIHIEQPVNEESNSEPRDIQPSAFNSFFNSIASESESVKPVVDQQANKTNYPMEDLKQDLELFIRSAVRKAVEEASCPSGGSKKNRTSKRHIKRRTKRHTQYKKRRHTKKRN